MTETAVDNVTSESGGFTPELLRTVAQAMQVANRPKNDCLNRDQREAADAITLTAYMVLARAALEASGIAELTEALRAFVDGDSGDDIDARYENAREVLANHG